MDNAPSDAEVRRKRLRLFIVVSAGAATLGFGIPLVYLLRKRTSATLLHEVANAPPRRSAASSIPNIRPARPAAATPQPAAPSSSKIPVAPTAQPPPTDDDFNGAIYSAKAFGLATLMVGAGAVAIAVGVKTWMGVKSTEEFAHRMRAIVLEKLPLLSERIHRSPEPRDHPEGATVDASLKDNVVAGVDWNWPDAEKRLKKAFEKDGFAGWGEAALQELEAEGRLERAKRFGSGTTSYSPEK